MASVEFSVKFVHQKRGGCVIDLPQGTNYIVGSSTEEGPGQADQPLAGVGAKA